MNLLDKVSENIFIFRPSNFPVGMVEIVEKASEVYPFTSVSRRPHLTMEFPTLFTKTDSSECAVLRGKIYQVLMVAIKEYVKLNVLSSLYPKKDFITISKLMPGEGMGIHVDNKDKSSNHFICMMYLNDNFDGGEINFPEEGVTYKPKAGELLLYKASLAHEVLPVTSGIRYSIGYGLMN